jgi:hypothetical protein
MATIIPMLRLLGQVATIFSIFCSSAGIAAAQAYPSKTVRIVVAFAAGGGTDVIEKGASLDFSFFEPGPFILTGHPTLIATI